MPAGKIIDGRGGALRRLLDGLYLGSGAVGAGFIAAITAIVLAQVFCNIANRVALLSFGLSLGWTIPDYAEIAGYFLAAATFFSAGYALSAGAHIRVGLGLLRMSPPQRLAAELIAAGAGAAMCAYFAYWSGVLVWESWRYGDRSPGLIGFPIWIPQTPIPIGLAILTVALLDRFVSSLVAGRAQTPEGEAE